MTDYSKDRRDATPVDPQVVERRAAQVDRRATVVADMVDRVEGAVKSLDGHIDNGLKSIDLSVMQTKLHVAASLDTVHHKVDKLSKDVDEKLKGSASRQRWQTIALVAVILSDIFGIWWRTQGRDIQHQILDAVKQCATERSR